MTTDSAGNTLEDARRIRLSSDKRRYRDFVGDKDSVDYYRFKLNRASFVNLTLGHQTEPAILALLNSRGRVVERSAAFLNVSAFVVNESINRSLNAGVYFIKVYRRKKGDNTKYTLTTAAFGSGTGMGTGTGNGNSSGASALFEDINPGSNGSDPTDLTVVGSTFYFAADNGTNGKELWKSDGTTAGTSLVRDINPGSASSNPTDLVNVNGTLYFAADNGVNGRELWKSDGTTTGTVLVRDINSGNDGTTPRSSNPTDLVNVNGTLYFAADNGVNGVELWKSDGTEAGTTLVRDINARQQGGNPLSSNPASLVSFNDTLYFAADNGVNGVELWKSDGTEAGTTLVRDINPGSDSSTPFDLVVSGSTLYFAADNGLNGAELWKSDGTADGTVLVRDINLGTNSSSPASLVDLNGVLYFAANNGTNGTELWKSDGTADGTAIVRDINLGANSSSPSDLVAVGNLIYFAADNGQVGSELWRSDGTQSGTVLVQDIYLGTSSSSPSALVNFNGRLFFAANNGTNGRELWSL